MTSEEVFVRGIEHRQRCRGDESLTSSLTNVSVALSIRPSMTRSRAIPRPSS